MRINTIHTVPTERSLISDPSGRKMATPKKKDNAGFGSASELEEEDVTRRQIHQLKEMDGNNVCADCGAAGIT